MVNLLELSLSLSRNGWSVFPLQAGKKIPATGHGFKDSSKDASRINSWWGRSPNANIGIATGVLSKLVVVDVDVKNKAKGKSSLKLIKGLLPKTFTVSTPSGGWHFYYEINAPVRSRNSFLSGIDIKADGGYVVGPGSVLDTFPGVEYSVTDNLPIAFFPEFLRQQINAVESNTVVHKKQNNQNYKHREFYVGPGNWHHPILREVARMVRRGFRDEEILSEMESYTLPGYTIDSTRREVNAMIIGARRKGFDK